MHVGTQETEWCRKGSPGDPICRLTTGAPAGWSPNRGEAGGIEGQAGITGDGLGLVESGHQVIQERLQLEHESLPVDLTVDTDAPEYEDPPGVNGFDTLGPLSADKSVAEEQRIDSAPFYT